MAPELAIPDSGPLISPGRMARLDLPDRFTCPIVITDTVADEVLRGLPGAPALTSLGFLSKRGPQPEFPRILLRHRQTARPAYERGGTAR